jgi:pSer/pThr/pTyr-binding forkhead associated (FHA) protein
VNVSRRHARIWLEESDCCVEDLGSKFGTAIDGTKLQPGEKVLLKEGSTIQLGDTFLQIQWSVEGSELPANVEAGLDAAVEISESLDANLSGTELAQPANTEVSRRQAMVQELPVEFRASARFDALLQTIIKRAVEIIPGAERGTLLLQKKNSETLLVGAFVSDQEPVVSETLARRALSEQKAFIWRRGFEGDPAQSVRRHRIESGMYAPLLRQGRTLGVISVDNPVRDSAFGDNDLRLLLAIANEAAVAVANHQFLLTFACHSVRVLPA